LLRNALAILTNSNEHWIGRTYIPRCRYVRDRRGLVELQLDPDLREISPETYAATHVQSLPLHSYRLRLSRRFAIRPLYHRVQRLPLGTFRANAQRRPVIWNAWA